MYCWVLKLNKGIIKWNCTEKTPKYSKNPVLKLIKLNQYQKKNC